VRVESLGEAGDGEESKANQREGVVESLGVLSSARVDKQQQKFAERESSQLAESKEKQGATKPCRNVVWWCQVLTSSKRKKSATQLSSLLTPRAPKYLSR